MIWLCRSIMKSKPTKKSSFATSIITPLADMQRYSDWIDILGSHQLSLITNLNISYHYVTILAVQIVLHVYCGMSPISIKALSGLKLRHWKSLSLASKSKDVKIYLNIGLIKSSLGVLGKGRCCPTTIWSADMSQIDFRREQRELTIIVVVVVIWYTIKLYHQFSSHCPN